MRDRFWVEELVQNARLALTCAERSDEVHLLAMMKAVENVYESSTALSEATRDVLLPDGEGTALRGVRNFYVHQYHRVDASMARRTVALHFPALLDRCEAWLATSEEGASGGATGGATGGSSA